MPARSDFCPYHAAGLHRHRFPGQCARAGALVTCIPRWRAGQAHLSNFEFGRAGAGYWRRADSSGCDFSRALLQSSRRTRVAVEAGATPFALYEWRGAGVRADPVRGSRQKSTRASAACRKVDNRLRLSRSTARLRLLDAGALRVLVAPPSAPEHQRRHRRRRAGHDQFTMRRGVACPRLSPCRSRSRAGIACRMVNEGDTLILPETAGHLRRLAETRRDWIWIVILPSSECANGSGVRFRVAMASSIAESVTRRGEGIRRTPPRRPVFKAADPGKQAKSG